VDQLSEKIANESKVGYTTLTKSVLLQIRKDAELLSNKKFDCVVWHFFRSPVTGKVGASAPLLKELERNNINYIIHE